MFTTDINPNPDMMEQVDTMTDFTESREYRPCLAEGCEIATQACIHQDTGLCNVHHFARLVGEQFREACEPPADLITYTQQGMTALHLDPFISLNARHSFGADVGRTHSLDVTAWIVGTGKPFMGAR